MKIPFLDLKKINSELEAELFAAFKQTVSSGWYILGGAGEVFEQELKFSLVSGGHGFVASCNSGTDALILSLRASGVSPGDEVITVSHTAIPTVTAIIAVGAKPVFVDIDENTWVMDINQVPSAITPRTKAIVPVHLYGNMVDMNRLQNVLSQFPKSGISVIEDVAQGHGSQLVDRQAGTFGRFGAFSFYPSKNIGALGDGGAVLCGTSEDFENLKALRNYGQKDRYHAEIQGGLNSRLDEIQAAILSIKLKRLVGWNKKKEALMQLYRDELKGLPISFQAVTPGCTAAWHLCVIKLKDQSTREAFVNYLNQEGIQTLIHYPIPAHRQKAFQNFSDRSLPVTDYLASRILSLPFNTALTEVENRYLIERVRSFFA